MFGVLLFHSPSLGVQEGLHISILTHHFSIIFFEGLDSLIVLVHTFLEPAMLILGFIEPAMLILGFIEPHLQYSQLALIFSRGCFRSK